MTIENRYEKMVLLKIPKHLNIRYNAPGKLIRRYVNIDPELVIEIKELWRKRIKTTGCCSGHGGQFPPYIGVDNRYISKMLRLGYKVQYNNCRPNDNDSFIPKLFNNKIKNKYGYCEFAFQGDEIGVYVHIFNLYIYPKYRKQGKAKKILESTIEHIRDTGYKGEIQIVANPTENNISKGKLTEFYEKLGLTVYECYMESI